MDGRSVIGWRFNLGETLGFGFSLASVAVAITLWSVTNFQSKVDAAEEKHSMEKRIEAVEIQMVLVRSSVDSVAKDVSYIRGRLEPKTR
jgi:hypothetical protein